MIVDACLVPTPPPVVAMIVVVPTTPNNAMIKNPGGNTTIERQFRDWLKSIDTNGDGRISKAELREALRKGGVGIKWWWTWRMMVTADLNRNSFIDTDEEIQMLMAYVTTNFPQIIRATN